MPSSAANFFNATVKPTVDEFFQSPLDIRRGRLAAIVLYHMADYWLIEHCQAGQKLQALHKTLIQECPDFVVVRDVADASKHATLRPQTEIPRTVSSAEQVSQTAGVFNAPFGTGVFNEGSMVIVTSDNGASRPLAGALRSVRTMWETKLAQTC